VGRRREGARATGAVRGRKATDGAGDRGSCVCKRVGPSGSLPDGGKRGSIDRACRRILGARTQASESGSRESTRDGWTPGESEARACPVHRPLREGPDPELRGARSGGEEAQESTDRGGLALARVLGRRENGLPGGAKLRSGRAGLLPASPAWTGSGRSQEACASTQPGRPSERREASSRLRCRGAPPGEPRLRAGASAESDAKPPTSPRRRWSNANPQGSTRPARAGTAPREGKALKGDSKGRERHETRPRSVGASR